MNAHAEIEPHSIEAEQQVLGSILLDNRVFHRVAPILKVGDFFDPVHGRIFETAAARIRAGQLADPVTLRALMEADEGLKELGGPAYLLRMAGAAISASSAADYAAMIVGLHAKRQLVAALRDGLQKVHSEDIATLAARLGHAMAALPEASGAESSISFLKATTDAVERAAKVYQGEQSLLQTGLPALDRVIGGLAPGDYCLICGTTSMGKTSLALEIAKNVAMTKGVVFSSLEMEPDQLAARIASSRANVPYAALRRADQMEEADFRKWVEGANASSQELSLRIIPKRIRDIPGIHAATKRAAGKFGKREFGLLVVDYAQLVNGAGKGRYEQMTAVSIGLKTMAGELGVPVVALCQLSRDIGQRDDTRPQLSDIKESGQFENDADQVLMCDRPEYWLTRRGPLLNKSGDLTVEAKADHEAALAASRNKMEIYVRKNRGGPVEATRVGFHAPTNRFWALGDGRDGEDREAF